MQTNMAVKNNFFGDVWWREVFKGTSSLFFTCALFEQIEIKQKHILLSKN